MPSFSLPQFLILTSQTLLGPRFFIRPFQETRANVAPSTVQMEAPRGSRSSRRLHAAQTSTLCAKCMKWL